MNHWSNLYSICPEQSSVTQVDGSSYLLAAPLPHPLAFCPTVLPLLQGWSPGTASTGTQQSEHPGSHLLLYPGFSGMPNVLHPQDIPLWSAEHKYPERDVSQTQEPHAPWI